MNKRRVPNTAETVDFSSFDYENVAGAGLKFLSVNVPYTAAFSNKLDLVVWVTMRTWAAALDTAKKKNGDVNVAVICSYEPV